jgi:hypothetical protein
MMNNKSDFPLIYIVLISAEKVDIGKKSVRVQKASFREKSEKVDKKSKNHDKHYKIYSFFSKF